MVHVRAFDAEADAIGAIRTYVQESMLRHGADDEAIDAAVLCASELATNALLHGDGPIVVDIDLGSRARVTVHDGNHRLPVLLRPAPDDDAGRGLMMVSVFADTWGTELDEQGKAVWFELDLQARQAPEPSQVADRRRWGRSVSVE